jgi:hypothetical protein
MFQKRFSRIYGGFVGKYLAADPNLRTGIHMRFSSVADSLIAASGARAACLLIELIATRALTSHPRTWLLAADSVSGWRQANILVTVRISTAVIKLTPASTLIIECWRGLFTTVAQQSLPAFEMSLILNGFLPLAHFDSYLSHLCLAIRTDLDHYLLYTANNVSIL